MISRCFLIISETIALDFRETIADILQEELFRLTDQMPLSERWTENNIALSLAADRSLYGEPLHRELIFPPQMNPIAWRGEEAGRETLG